MKAKKLFFLFLIIIAVSASYFILSEYKVSSQTFIVTLTPEGFSPASLQIHQGDSVTFITKNGKSFWPASDPHPTHGIYSGFDPRQPIDPEKSWTFKFDDYGIWKYHDHLWSAYRGTIEVKKRSIFFGTAKIDVGNCQNERSNPQCWQSLIESALEEEGLDGAFEVLADLYSSEPKFASECHSYTHNLGTMAYEKFSRKESLTFSAKAFYCGYGFYHGFMESLLHSEGTAEEARDFCTHIGKTLADQTSDAEGACYHGIGHGAVDGGDPGDWGDPQKMIDPGIKLCEYITQDKEKLFRCVTGAFNALEILSMDPKYQLSMIAQDPFWLCPKQPEPYQEPCYTNMLPSLLRFVGNDLSLAVKRIEKIPADISNPSLRLLGYPTRKMVTQGLFHEYVRLNFNKPDYNIQEGVMLCRSLKEDMRMPCIEGLSGGYMKYGEPGREYIKGLDFCSRDLLSDDEQRSCFEYILTRLNIWYSQDKVKEICSMGDPIYRNLCGI